ncbi:MAG: metalloregulator ArsR/SmtB family transcription factor [Synechococcales cyanobacterium]
MALARVADYFKMLAEVSRLQILCALQQGSLNVSEIMAATGMGQANVSKHLKLLTQAGLVHRHPQGVSVYYEIANPAIFELCEVVCKQLLVHHAAQSQELEQLAHLHRPMFRQDAGVPDLPSA